VARSQVAAQLAAVPGGDALLAAFDAAMQEFAAGRPVPTDERFPEGMQMLILGLTNPANQPFARELWVTDPSALLAMITAPVLIAIGKKDIQVDWLVFIGLAHLINWPILRALSPTPEPARR
jgi:pimeloyl-ACP methyl ester carboxylesterase